MLSCEVVTDLMAACESGEASGETRRLVDEHLAGCVACRGAFGKGDRVDSALARSRPVPVEKPVNGAGFVFRTRRLLFFVGVGVVLFLAVQAAVVMRMFNNTLVRAMEPHPGLPGIPAFFLLVTPQPMLLVTVAATVAYFVLVLSTARRPQVSREGAIARAVMGGVLLAILAIATLYLWVVGPPGPGLLVLALLLAALAVTAVRLSRLPYFTMATIVSLAAAIVVLLNLVLVSRMAGGL
jgi:predicted anti-sigma-YlaC factor YlaD